MRISITEISAMINNTHNAIEQFKKENPGVDVEAVLAEQQELPQALRKISGGELKKFIAYAKCQGIKMPFDAIEMGILTAGRRDMRDGLAEILNAIDFDKPICVGCAKNMTNRGRNKKK
jgi:hypothetical protein